MDREKLLLVGGAEILHRAEIMRAFVELAGGPGGPFLILPTATSKPLKQIEKMRRWFSEAGVESSRVETLELSGFVPGWEGGARDARQLARLEVARGLWMLGGDQNEITARLLEAGGSDTPLLAAIRRRLAAGSLAVGGTSAGAAVMCDPMIGGGTSFGALALGRAARGAGGELSRELALLRGLGLFAEGLVDQHFDTRARLGRLLVAAIEGDVARRPAFGIAEATGLLRRGGAGGLSVVGSGSVIVLDPRSARLSFVPTESGLRRRIEGALIHCLTAGDSYEPGEGRIDFGSKEALGPADAALAAEFPEASGILSAYGDLAGFAARMLLDNQPEGLFLDPGTGRRYVRSLLVEESPGPGGVSRPLAWELRLGRIGLGGAGPGESRLLYDGRYSFENVVVDIIPIDISIRRPA
jgi:cyanophycinase